MLCTVQEIAAFFRISVTTLMNRQAADPKIAEVMARGRAMGSISVRREQFKMLKGGNSTMGVWLGKQVCGQRDVMKVEASGPDGGPIQTIDPAKLAALSDDELTRIIDTVGRLAALGTDGGAGSPPP